MKKYISIVIAAMLAMTGLCACRLSSASDEKKLQIVTTIFPEYDWVQNVLGENPSGAEVTMLLDNGVDLHSYQPTAEDILKISTCDLFIYVGGESDEWVEDALKKIDAKNASVYEKNAASYKEKLSALDAKYAQAVSEARVKTLLFGDRFPFRYLVDDYGLTYYAAFVGCDGVLCAGYRIRTEG